MSVIVVSGHPRSGTSMMMQMLEAGGVPVVCGTRADEDNPRGYYELPDGAYGPDFIHNCEGKALKVTAGFLSTLPRGPDYQILYMHRALDEVVASFATMSLRRGRVVIPRHEIEVLHRCGRSIATAVGVSVLDVSYNICLRDPAATAQLVAEYLGRSLNVSAMAAAVDVCLYRNRTELLPCEP